MKCTCTILKQESNVLHLDCDCQGQTQSKSKRKPSAYNIFMGKCIKERETKGPIAERFKHCVEHYKSEKHLS